MGGVEFSAQRLEESGILDQSGITNFSLEFEMLNKLHVSKNNPLPLKNLPVVSD